MTRLLIKFSNNFSLHFSFLAPCLPEANFDNGLKITAIDNWFSSLFHNQPQISSKLVLLTLLIYRCRNQNRIYFPLFYFRFYIFCSSSFERTRRVETSASERNIWKLSIIKPWKEMYFRNLEMTEMMISLKSQAATTRVARVETIKRFGRFILPYSVTSSWHCWLCRGRRFLNNLSHDE